MNSSKWGPYGWIMIHSVSQLGLQPKRYYRFLEKLQQILPCKFCRNNFWRNLRALKHSLPHESSQLPLWSIHVHNSVSLDIDPDADIWEPMKTLHLLPEVSVETLFPKEFFYAVSLNVNDEERIPVLLDFIKEYRKILSQKIKLTLKSKDIQCIEKSLETLEKELSQKYDKQVIKENVKINMIHFTDTIVKCSKEGMIPSENEIVQMIYRSEDSRKARVSSFIRKTRKSKYKPVSADSDIASKSRKKSS